MSNDAQKVPGQITRAINRFQAAAIAEAWKGARHPDEAPHLEEELRLSRASLEKAIVKLVTGNAPVTHEQPKALKGIAVSNRMVGAAQASYDANRNPEYGLTDSDMKKAIEAAMEAYGK